MAEVVKYYLANNIVVYPGNNSTNDEGKLNTETNMAAIVTRITERNYCLHWEDFVLSVEPDTDYGFVIQISEGQANIQGYHVITDSPIRVRPPQVMTGKDIALGFKLSRDGSKNLLGDVTYNTITEYEGVWLSYFNKEEAKKDPDIFILGYVDWDGDKFDNVKDNPEKVGRIDASTVICELHDPKHPELEFIYLQDWMNIVPDWYVSKEGDVEYGNIDFLPGRVEGDDKNVLEDPSLGNKDPGIHIQAETDYLSVIQMMASANQNNGHELYFTVDDESAIKNSTILFKYMGEDRGKLYIKDPLNWLELFSNTTLHLDSVDETLINSDNAITQVVNGDNNLTAKLTAKDFSLLNPLNDKKINFTIDQNDLQFLLGDALFNYNNLSDRLTISGLDRVIFEDRVQIKNHLGVDSNLYLGPDGTGTVLNQNQWILDTPDQKQTFDNDGHTLKQKTDKVVRTRWEDNTGNEFTEITPAGIKMKGENAGITIVNKAGDEVSITINKDGNIYIEGDTIINGSLTPEGNDSKIWGAVYN